MTFNRGGGGGCSSSSSSSPPSSSSSSSSSSSTSDSSTKTADISKVVRHGDQIILSIKLESSYADRIRYFTVINRSEYEYAVLGIDEMGSNVTLGLSLQLFRDTTVSLDGDGGFSLFQSAGGGQGRHFIFKPVSVQALWTVIQTLHMISEKLNSRSDHFPEKVSFLSDGSYVINSCQSCINEWHAMSDLLVKRPPSPDHQRSLLDTETLIKVKLREIMKAADLDNITSKGIRVQLELEMDTDLEGMKSYIDKEILQILGQMDPASKILDYLYLGSEWNASNLDELRVNGITHILNVTREIDNFFPAIFTYKNIRVYDEEATDLLRHMDNTFKFIKESRDLGGRVLVHCRMGISRSATVTISYIMKEYNRSLEDTLFHVKERRPVVNPNKSFLKQLEVYEGILGAIRHRHTGLFRSKSESSLKPNEKTNENEKKKTKRRTTQIPNKKEQEDLSSSADESSVKISSSSTTKINVKALANVFSRPNSEPVMLNDCCRPKSWSPSERLSHLLLTSNDNNNLGGCPECFDIIDKNKEVPTVKHNPQNCNCNVELELKVPMAPVIVNGNHIDEDEKLIVQNLSDLPIKIRTKSNNPPKPTPSTVSVRRTAEEELSVKTIANMFDFKEPTSLPRPPSYAKLEDSKLFKKAQKINEA